MGPGNTKSVSHWPDKVLCWWFAGPHSLVSRDRKFQALRPEELFENGRSWSKGHYGVVVALTGASCLLPELLHML